MTKISSVDSIIPQADIAKRAARIGAEIRNIKLSGDLPAETITAINSLLLEHKVLFFRDQGHLDNAEQERFALRFGTLMAYPILGAIEGTVSMIELDSARPLAEPTSGTATGPSSRLILKSRSCEAL